MTLVFYSPTSGCQLGLGSVQDTSHAIFGREYGPLTTSWLRQKLNKNELFSRQTRIYHQRLHNCTWDCSTGHEITWLVYTTQVNSTFRARWLASSEVISRVLFIQDPEELWEHWHSSINQSHQSINFIYSQIYRVALKCCRETFKFQPCPTLYIWHLQFVWIIGRFRNCQNSQWSWRVFSNYKWLPCDIL